MDDRLQRRIRDVDPLTAGDGQVPATARLDEIKEQLMLSETQDAGMPPAPERPASGGRRSIRPRAIGFTALAAGGLAAVLVVGTLVRPTSSALAWDPSPSSVTDAQRAAAKDACTVGIQQAPGGVTGPESAPVVVGGSSVGGGGSITGGQDGTGKITVTTGEAGGAAPAVDGAVPETGVSTGGTVVGSVPSTIRLPELPSELPPLVYMEQHGTGAVAVFADKDTTAYCLLVRQDDGYQLAALQLPMHGGGAMGVGVAVGVTGAGPAGGMGVSSSSMALAGDGDFVVTAMSVAYDGGQVGIVAGSAPDGATAIEVKGGPADGATATVTDGRFALWAPEALDGSTTLVAVDGSGAELGTVNLDAAPPPPAPAQP
jgi:hypothetical protein